MILLKINVTDAATEKTRSEQFSKEILDIIETYQVPGMAVAVVSSKNVIYKKTFGVIDNHSNKKVTDKTVFQLASLSKGFLGATLAMLVDDKKFNWDDIVQDNIKGFNLANLDYSKRLTFHHVASMQSGLPTSATSEKMAQSYDRQTIIKNFAEVDSSMAPGSKKFTYQYALLAVFEQLIEKVTGKKWEHILHRKILKPLKLNSTGVGAEKLENLKDVARPHNQENCVEEWESFKVNSAAGIYSNLEDMIKWLQFYLKDGKINGKRLIAKKQMIRMHTPHSVMENKELRQFASDNIIAANYGYFWKILDYKIDNKIFKLIEHNGNCLGMSSIISYIPEHRLGIVVLSNKQTPAPEVIREKFINLYINKK